MIPQRCWVDTAAAAFYHQNSHYYSLVLVLPFYLRYKHSCQKRPRHHRQLNANSHSAFFLPAWIRPNYRPILGGGGGSTPALFRRPRHPCFEGLCLPSKETWIVWTRVCMKRFSVKLDIMNVITFLQFHLRLKMITLY